MNIEHRTSNIEYRSRAALCGRHSQAGTDIGPNSAVGYSLLDIRYSFFSLISG